MKIAQEIRAGQVIMVGSDAMVVQKAEFNKSGRNAAVVKMKMKNLLTGAGLLVRTFLNVARRDLGFDSRAPALVLEISPRQRRSFRDN